MKTLKQLTKGFNYVNSDITEANFPLIDRKRKESKIFKFDRYISSKDVIKEMAKEGYEPANLYELLQYKGEEKWVVALGSVCGLRGSRHVAYLGGDAGHRELRLNYLDGDWNDYYRFLGVRKSELSSKTLNTSDLRNLELRIKALEDRLNKYNLV